MSQKAIREYDGKRMLGEWLADNSTFHFGRVAQLRAGDDLDDMPTHNAWLKTEKLVAKPDQLIKRRGKAGLLNLNADWAATADWIRERRGQDVAVEKVNGVLDTFIVEPFVPHAQADEYYLCVHSQRHGDEILFYHEGGVDVGDVDAKAVKWLVPIGHAPTEQEIEAKLLGEVPAARRPGLAQFVERIFTFYVDLHFAYLEINPLVMLDDGKTVIALDMAAKVDETAHFEVGTKWGAIDFPPPFGRPPMPSEAYVKRLDGKTGASLKLTILNPEGRIWTMVAGGGASVIYADTISDLGFGAELANYGEYSGAPSESVTFEYASTLLTSMTSSPKRDNGKVLLIGGGIANFTDVASTFKGIIRAITMHVDAIKSHDVRIFVRRGGPNYQQGLQQMRDAGVRLDLDIQVYGPESHMTEICALALGVKDAPAVTSSLRKSTSLTDLAGGGGSAAVPSKREAAHQAWMSGGSDDGSSDATRGAGRKSQANGSVEVLDTLPELSQYSNPVPSPSPTNGDKPAATTTTRTMFTPKTRAIIYGMQPTACQNMLDFDFICGRERPSVAAMVYPFTGNHYQKFYWNTSEMLVPIFQSLAEAVAKFPDVDVVVNFASFRSVYESTTEILAHAPQIKTVAIIAEGVPERRTRALLKAAADVDVAVIGPATVGGIKPGCFRIGNTGGMLDNVLSSRLYRPGSVAYVARSGGMSNELNNILARHTDGVYEGVAIGGDMYPGTSFMDHLLRYQRDDNVKMIVVLGEVGGTEEYNICDAITAGTLTKPIVAWCIGTCAKMFPYEVQFGHAGACADSERTSADAKNAALAKVGCAVPVSFDAFGDKIAEVYDKLVVDGAIEVKPELPPPNVPIDYAWARKLGLIRKPASFISSIVDERGDELNYGGMNISKVFEAKLGLGGTLGLLWFRRRLPDYCCRFIETVLMITADHGPAVSGAHNTIVAARAGKDLVSSLCSGLLTIGPRFGGALDGAAKCFTWAYDQKLTPEAFVQAMRKRNELIMGIGHKIKSLENPDVRVTVIKEFAQKHFKTHPLLDYACEVEKLTSKKKSNLILNVDGCIAVCFVDMLRSCGAFTLDEVSDICEWGTLNGLFVLGRSMGFIGHFLDQKRLKQGLYRHPVEDITYLVGQDLSL